MNNGILDERWSIGDRIEGRWEVKDVLTGGMGFVYIVFDHEWKVLLAAKTFRDEPFGSNPVIEERFKQEALAWIRMDAHPNIAKAYIVFDIGRKLFIFSE